MKNRSDPQAILEKYYLSLSNWQSDDAVPPLQKPLWQLRQLELEEEGIFHQLGEIARLPAGDDPVLFLLKMTWRCNGSRESTSENIISINHKNLPCDERRKLLEIAETGNGNKLAAYATSILVTLFLRSANRQYRIYALDLLCKGEAGLKKKHINPLLGANHPVGNDISLELSNHADLLHDYYIDFSHGIFSDLGLVDLNLSGQYLKSVRAENATFGKNVWRYACLDGGRFRKATFAEGHDFTGCNLWKANFSEAGIDGCCLDMVNAFGALFINAKGRKTHWQKANLCHAFLCGEKADFSEAVFLQTHVTRASFQDTELQGAEFIEVTGLNMEQLQQSKTPLDFITIRAFAPSPEVYVEERRQLKLLEDLIDAEKKDYVAGSFRLWPGADGNHEWVEKKGYSLCELRQEDRAYQLLRHFLHMSSDTVSYQSRRAEFSRLMKAGSNFFRFLLQDIRNPPRHEGQIGNIQIHGIEVNRNPDLLKRYQNRRKEIERELGNLGITAPLAGITWTRESVLGLPELNRSSSEVLLVNGLRKRNDKGEEVVPLIFSNGFRTENDWQTGRGYGPLGQGSYFTDSFAKAATYTECPGCNRNQCACSPEKQQQLINSRDVKVMIVSRVLMGRVHEHRKQDRQNANGPPAGYHSVWGSSQERNPDSEFRQNEFVIRDKDQIYPEFCIYYTDNAPALEMRADDSLESQTAGGFQELEKILENYQAVETADWLSHQYAFGELRLKLARLLERPYNLEQQVSINRLINLIRRKESGMRKTEIMSPCVHWVLDYFHHGEWGEVLYLLENHVTLPSFSPEWNFRLSFIEGISSYREGHDFARMVNAFNRAWYLGKQVMAGGCDGEAYLAGFFMQEGNEKILEKYYCEGLLLLESAEAEASPGPVEMQYYRRVAEWAARKWTAEEWKRHYWKLSGNIMRRVFREALLEVNPGLGKQVADECGKRVATHEGWMEFHQQLNGIQGAGRGEVEISWLALGEDRSWRIRTGYLKQEHAQLLFRADGSLQSGDAEREQQGRSLVRCLRDTNGKAVSYVKFYPHHPLRQYAVDSLCARLGGYHARTTLACLRHGKAKHGCPVLLSMPVGALLHGQPVTLHDHYLKQSDAVWEGRVSREGFTWKFLESLLVLPGDDKGDNLVPVRTGHGREYTLVSVDTDECLVQEVTGEKSVSVHALIWLMEGMNQPLDGNVVQEFMARNWDGLLQEWVDELQGYVDCLLEEDEVPGLFDMAELKELEKLRREVTKSTRGSRSYNVHCDPEALFRENDLPALYQRIQRLRVALEEYQALAQGEAGKTHWDVLTAMYPALAARYHAAFMRGRTAMGRFQHLPGVNEHFEKQKAEGVAPVWKTAVEYRECVLLWEEKLPEVLEPGVLYLVRGERSHVPVMMVEEHEQTAQVVGVEGQKALERIAGLPAFPEQGTEAVVVVDAVMIRSVVLALAGGKEAGQAVVVHASRQPVVSFLTLIRENHAIVSCRALRRQGAVLQGIRRYCDSFYMDFAQVQAGRLEKFRDPDYPPFLKERILGQLDWERLEQRQGDSLQVLKAAVGTSFHHLRLRECAVLTFLLLQSLLSPSPRLARLQLAGSGLDGKNLGQLLDAHCQQLQELEVTGSDLTWITTWTGAGYVALPHLRRLVIRDCPQLERIEILSPDLLELEIRNCPKLSVLVTCLSKQEELPLVSLEITRCASLSPEVASKLLGKARVKNLVLDEGWTLRRVLEMAEFTNNRLEEVAVPVTRASLPDMVTMLAKNMGRWPGLRSINLQQGFVRKRLEGHGDVLVSGSWDTVPRIYRFDSLRLLPETWKNIESLRISDNIIHAGSSNCRTVNNLDLLGSVLPDMTVQSVDEREITVVCDNLNAKTDWLCMITKNRITADTFTPGISTLRVLELQDSDFKGITAGEGDLIFLERLVVRDCPEFVSVVIHSPDLMELEISNCPKLSTLMTCLTDEWPLSLVSLRITGCTSLPRKNLQAQFLWRIQMVKRLALDEQWTMQDVSEIIGAELEEVEVPVTEMCQPTLADMLPSLMDRWLGLRRIRLQQLVILRKMQEEHGDGIRCVASLGNGQLVSGSWDRTLRIWELATGNHVKVLDGHEGPVTCVASLGNGQLVSGSEDRTLRIWKVATRECIRIFTGHAGAVTCVASLQDGQILVSGSQDGTLMIWEAGTGKRIGILKGHSSGITCIAPLKGNFLASGSRDKMLRIWNINTQQCIHVLEGHNDPVTCAAAFGNGQLISGSGDTLRIWDVATGKYVRRVLMQHGDWVRFVASLGDGELVCGLEDRTLRIWKIGFLNLLPETWKRVESLTIDGNIIRIESCHQQTVENHAMLGGLLPGMSVQSVNNGELELACHDGRAARKWLSIVLKAERANPGRTRRSEFMKKLFIRTGCVMTAAEILLLDLPVLEELHIIVTPDERIILDTFVKALCGRFPQLHNLVVEWCNKTVKFDFASLHPHQPAAFRRLFAGTVDEKVKASDWMLIWLAERDRKSLTCVNWQMKSEVESFCNRESLYESGYTFFVAASGTGNQETAALFPCPDTITHGH